MKEITNKSVWYISKYSISPKYGSATRQYLYSKYFVKNGYDVKLISSVSAEINHDLITMNSYYYNDEIEGVNCVILNGPKIKYGFSLKRIFSWIYFEINLFRYIIQSKEIPEVVIVSSLSLLSILNGIYLKKKFKIKLIFEIRDIWPLTLIEIGGFSKYNPFIIFLRIIEKWGYLESDVIIGTMPNLKEHVRNSISRPVNFKSIPMGFDDENYYCENKDFHLPTDKFIVGYSGAIGLVNRVIDIVDSAKILKDNTEIFFAILGNGPLKISLMQQTKDLKNIIFIPKQNKKYVNAFLKNCDVLIHPCKKASIYKFGISPNKWIDYMYSATPIIACFDGYRSIINDANCGEFIEAENPVLLSQTILEYKSFDKTKLGQIGKNGRNYLFENLTYDILSKEYIKLF